MATIQQIEKGAVRFIDAEVAPNIPVNVPNGQIKKIAAVAGAVYAVRHGLRKALDNPVLASIGAVDEAGNIDVEGIAEAASAQIPEDGFKLTVPILGDLTFFREDLERLKTYIMKEA